MVSCSEEMHKGYISQIIEILVDIPFVNPSLMEEHKSTLKLIKKGILTLKS